MHKNLFVSYILSALLWILYYKLVTMDTVVVKDNPVSKFHIYSIKGGDNAAFELRRGAGDGSGKIPALSL